MQSLILHLLIMILWTLSNDENYLSNNLDS